MWACQSEEKDEDGLINSVDSNIIAIENEGIRDF